MLNNETPKEWKRESILYSVVSAKDKYNNETLKVSQTGVRLDLCWQPIDDDTVLEAYGIKHEGGIQAVLYDFSIDIKPNYRVKYGSEMYEVRGIKKYLFHRRIIAKRVTANG